MANPLTGYYTTTQAAAVLDVTERRVRQFLREGRLRGVKLALGADKEHHPWLISRAEVRRFAKVNRPNGRPRTKPPS